MGGYMVLDCCSLNTAILNVGLMSVFVVCYSADPAETTHTHKYSEDPDTKLSHEFHRSTSCYGAKCAFTYSDTSI